MSFEAVIGQHQGDITAIADVHNAGLAADALAGQSAQPRRFNYHGYDGFSTIASPDLASPYAYDSSTAYMVEASEAIGSKAYDRNPDRAFGFSSDVDRALVHEQWLHGPVVTRRSAPAPATLGSLRANGDPRTAYAATYQAITRGTPLMHYLNPSSKRDGNIFKVGVVGPEEVVNAIHNAIISEATNRNPLVVRRFANFVLGKVLGYPEDDPRFAAAPRFEVAPPETHLQVTTFAGSDDPTSGRRYSIPNRQRQNVA